MATGIESAGGRAVFVPADITRDDDIERLMDTAVDTFGGIDVLHNNAGIHDAMLTSDLSFEELRIDVFDRVLAVNLRAPFVCAKAAVPHLRRSTRGPSIINAPTCVVGFACMKPANLRKSQSLNNDLPLIGRAPSIHWIY